MTKLLDLLTNIDKLEDREQTLVNMIFFNEDKGIEVTTFNNRVPINYIFTSGAAQFRVFLQHELVIVREELKVLTDIVKNIEDSVN